MVAEGLPWNDKMPSRQVSHARIVHVWLATYLLYVCEVRAEKTCNLMWCMKKILLTA